MTSETLQPIRKAAAFTFALAVARTRMNTTIVAGDRPARRPRRRMVRTKLMRGPVLPSRSLDESFCGVGKARWSRSLHAVEAGEGTLPAPAGAGAVGAWAEPNS